MITFEQQYQHLVKYILNFGELRRIRNGMAKSIFGRTISFDTSNIFIPLLRGRNMFYKGVFGELCAMLRTPTNIADFKKFGCNYWDLWADKDGNIDIDYGKAWLDFNGINQLDEVMETIRLNPTDRRMIISGWRPDRLEELSLPCCHYAYQFYVRYPNSAKCLDMLWHQRSVDVMIGLPSDMIFATAWLKAIAHFTGCKAGRITMTLGDTHIYDEHIKNAEIYVNTNIDSLPLPTLDFKTKAKTIYDILPSDFIVERYSPVQELKFKLKA